MPLAPVAPGASGTTPEGEAVSWHLLWMGEAEGLETELTAAAEEEEVEPAMGRPVAEPAVVWLNNLPQVSFVPAPIVTEMVEVEVPEATGEAAPLGAEAGKGEMPAQAEGEAVEAPVAAQVELAAAEDKGEVIWSADLVVRESGEGEKAEAEPVAGREAQGTIEPEAAPDAVKMPEARPVEAKPVREDAPATREASREAKQVPVAEAPARGPVRAETVEAEQRPREAVKVERPAAEKPAQRAETNPPSPETEQAEPAEAAPVANGRETAGREQGGREEGQRDDDGGRSERREAGRQEPLSRKAERAPMAELETPAAIGTEPAARTEGAKEGAAGKPLSVEMAGVQAAEGPKPLRPAQVATLQMDVRPTDAAEDAAPVRLVVSQRGDQVNVRVRSWDATAAPLSEEQMRPLVESLAGQGYQRRSAEGIRMDEGLPAAIERTAERMEVQQGNLTGGGEQQTQHGAEDRQQQQRERQQQQAENLRRNLRREPAAEFNLAELTAETGEGRK